MRMQYRLFRNLCFSFVLTLLACQAPVYMAPQPHVQTFSQTPQTTWTELANLRPEEQQTLQHALSQRTTQNVEALDSDRLRKIAQELLPTLTQAYQEMLQPRVIQADRLPPGSRLVQLQSHDQLSLKAAYLPAKHPTQQAIIVLHGYQLNKYMAWKKYGFLQEHYNLLFLDLRGHNAQQGQATLGILEKRDLPAAIEWLKTEGNQTFGLFGESMGGAIAIVAGSEWAHSIRQNSFPLKAVWNDAAYADLEHAIEERVLRKLAQKSGLTPDFLKRWAARLITHTFLNWLAEDTQVANAEQEAAPKYYLPLLVQKSAYAQVHSLEDEMTDVSNAIILEHSVHSGAIFPPVFWYTHGKHVDSWKQPEYQQRALTFFDQAFALGSEVASLVACFTSTPNKTSVHLFS